MIKYIQTLFFLLLMMSAVTFGQNLLNGPECVSYDSLNNRYLVSNYNNGNIIAIDSNGNQSYFKQRSGHALGNCIEGNTFYVSIGNTVLGLSLDNPNDTIMYLPIAGTTQLDGMTTDNNNNLYVIASIQAKIYKINLITQTYSIFVNSGISAKPQDVVYDKKNNRLLICSWYAGSPIQSVDLTDSTVSNIVSTPSGNCDGLAIDEEGYYYYSTWTNNAVYRYDSSFTNPPELFSSGHSGPSNICFNEKENVIAVPNFNSNSVNFVPIIPTKVEKSEVIPFDFKLFQNYPNPFNSSTIIQYQIPKNGFVSLKIFNLLGNEIETLVYETKQAGNYNIKLDAFALSAGVYFYQLKTNDYSCTKKMLYLK